MERCRFTWFSQFRHARVQCWHEAGHPSQHEAWNSRKERRRSPSMASWVAPGAEDEPVLQGEWLTD